MKVIAWTDIFYRTLSPPTYNASSVNWFNQRRLKIEIFINQSLGTLSESVLSTPNVILCIWLLFPPATYIGYKKNINDVLILNTPL